MFKLSSQMALKMNKLCLQEVLKGLHRGMTYVNCNCLNVFTHDCETCFRHVMLKACQYATNDIKVGVGMKEANLVEAQFRNNYMNKKVWQGEARMGVGLQGGWLESMETKNTRKNQVHSQGYFIS
jgi:hypothetical protein